MTSKTIVTCDVCGVEIRDPGAYTVTISDHDGTYSNPAHPLHIEVDLCVGHAEELVSAVKGWCAGNDQRLKKV